MSKQVALVGGAHIHTPGFAKKLAENADVETRYVWDPDPKVAKLRQETTGGEVVGDLDVILKDDAVDAVVICSQTKLHEELVLKTVEAGKDLFVEKPLGMQAEDAYRMAEAIEKAGVLFQTGFFMRGRADVQYARQLMQEGKLGTVTRVRLSNCHAGALGGWFDTDWRWMADVEQAGVGGFGDLGAHIIDLLLWMLGDDKPTLATASIGSVTGRYPGCDEFGEGLIRFESGAVGSLAAGWLDVDNPNFLEISGTEGHVIINNPAGGLIVKSDHVEGGDGKTPLTPPQEAWPHAFDLFLEALVSGDRSRLVGPKETAHRNAVSEALYQGAEAGSWAAVDWR